MPEPNTPQQAVNQTEWENPSNWSGWFWDIYFSKADSRWWVRRRNRWMGWTFNYAHPAGVRYFYASLLFALCLFLGIGLAIGWLIGRSA